MYQTQNTSGGNEPCSVDAIIIHPFFSCLSYIKLGLHFIAVADRGFVTLTNPGLWIDRS